MVMVNQLYPEVVKICRPLIVEDEVLKLCVKKFCGCIARALNIEEANKTTLKCNETYINDFPDGSECGKAIGLDISGKIFRVVYGVFRGERVYGVVTRLYEIPEVKLQGSGYKVIEYIARCVANFIETYNVKDEKIILGVSLGFPIEQECLQDARLLRWTREFKCEDFIHESFFSQLKIALKKYKYSKNVYLIAATKDSSSSLLAGLYKDPTTRIGLTVGDCINTSYVERQKNISVFPGDSLRSRAVIDIDVRSFGDDGCLDFIKTDFDTEIENSSKGHNRYTFQKLISGQYLGEILRLCLIKLINEQLILDGVLRSKIRVSGVIRSEHLAEMESDDEKNFERCRLFMRRLGYSDVSDEDCLQIRFACRCIARRSANLVAAFLAALINHMETKEVRICGDGFLLKQFPNYKSYLVKKIDKLKKSEYKYILTLNEKEDLGLGAGLLAFIYKDGVIKVEDKHRSLPPPRNASFAINGPCRECDVSADGSSSGVFSIMSRDGPCLQIS